MMNQLDHNLILKAYHPRKDGMSFADRVAANVLWRDGVSIPVLTKLFKRAKNTLYKNALTGEAQSYSRYHLAREINDLVEELGIDEARRRYVTDDMVRFVDAANAAKVACYGG